MPGDECGERRVSGVSHQGGGVSDAPIDFGLQHRIMRPVGSALQEEPRRTCPGDGAQLSSQSVLVGGPAGGGRPASFLPAFVIL